MLTMWKLWAASLVLPQTPVAAPAIATAPAGDSAILAAALDGRPLALTMRGSAAQVAPQVVPAENGCAVRLAARGHGRSQTWSRLLRWSDLAWSGAGPDGTVRVAFYDHEGRLPVDMVSFRPDDATRFLGALAPVAAACRQSGDDRARVLGTDFAAARSCYFKALPQLQLYDAGMPGPHAHSPRAMLTLLSRERPDAELQLLFERPPPSNGDAAPAGTQIAAAFVFADARLADLQIARAGFALDDAAIEAPHAVAIYGDTRVRVTLDPPPPGAGSVNEGFVERLDTSGAVTLYLRDAARRDRAVVRFDVGGLLAEARRALAAADWSCAAAQPAPPPAAQWVIAP